MEKVKEQLSGYDWKFPLRQRVEFGPAGPLNIGFTILYRSLSEGPDNWEEHYWVRRDDGDVIGPIEAVELSTSRFAGQ